VRRILFTSSVVLPAIAAEKVEDVREVLEYYQQYPNPVEAFREKQRKLLVRGSVVMHGLLVCTFRLLLTLLGCGEWKIVSLHKNFDV
jgi:hypothetical protein